MLIGFVYPLDQSKPQNYKYGWVHIITYIMVWSFCVMKPFLYVYTNKYFRKAFYETFAYFKPNDYVDNIIEEVHFNVKDSNVSDSSYSV